MTSSESSDSSYSHHDVDYSYGKDSHFGRISPASTQRPHLYGANTYRNLQAHTPQPLESGDLPLPNLERFQQPETEVFDTGAESEDADEEGYDEEDLYSNSADSESGSDEALSNAAVRKGDLEWTRPQFGPTKIYHEMTDKHAEKVGVDIDSWWEKDLGFIEQPPHHVQYRRNFLITTKSKYMLVSRRCPEPEDWLYLKSPTTGKLMMVQALGMRLRGVLDEENGVFAEVLHLNNKRDRIGIPMFKQLRPSNGEGRGDPILWRRSTGHFDKERVKIQVASFDHYQFREATRNNGARRKQQTFHKIVHDLIAVVGTPEQSNQEEIRVASRTSGALETRGRCPKSFEIYNKSNPHHNRRKEQTADDRHQKKLKARAANNRKDLDKSRRPEHKAGIPPPRTRSQRRQLRTIAAQPEVSSIVPALSHDDSTRTSTVGSSSPNPAMGTQEVSYVPNHDQGMLRLDLWGPDPPIKQGTDFHGVEECDGRFHEASESLPQFDSEPWNHTEPATSPLPIHFTDAANGSTVATHHALGSSMEPMPSVEEYQSTPHLHRRWR